VVVEGLNLFAQDLEVEVEVEVVRLNLFGQEPEEEEVVVVEGLNLFVQILEEVEVNQECYKHPYLQWEEWMKEEVKAM